MNEPLKITLQAWRVFSLLEETGDTSVGRSLSFIADNLHTFTPAVLEEAIEELLRSDLIESINGMNRYRLNRAPELTIRESFLLGSSEEQSGHKPDVASALPADEEGIKGAKNEEH